ncbi:DUF2441 domain-containing protein [Bradyrhizobium diazoefficiens]
MPIRAIPAAACRGKLWLDVGQPHIVWPAIRIGFDMMAAAVISAVDQHVARAHGAHLFEGDFLGVGRHQRQPEGSLVMSLVVTGCRAAGRAVKGGTMRKFYHVGSGHWKPGDSIAPGNWGKQTRQFGKGAGFRGYGSIGDAVIVGWEVALEVARQLTAPDAPSRQNCVFCTEDLASARSFRDRFANGGSIYEVEVEATATTHAGNYEAITDVSQGPSFDTHIATAKSYWTDAPTGIREVLVGGPVKVLAKID